MTENPVSRSRLADEILASLTRIEDRIDRTHRSVALITWSLATAAVLQIGAVAAALIVMHQWMGTMGSTLDESVQNGNSGLSGNLEEMMQQLSGLEKKVDSRPSGAPSSNNATEILQELLSSPELKGLLQQQSQSMKENWGILEGHKPDESNR